MFQKGQLAHLIAHLHYKLSYHRISEIMAHSYIFNLQKISVSNRNM